jgi:hypothetical protein
VNLLVKPKKKSAAPLRIQRAPLQEMRHMKAARVMKTAAALLTAVMVTGAAANAAPPAKKKGDELAVKSTVLGTPFPDKPYVLHDDGAYAEYMDALAKEQGRKCKGLEALGWDLKIGDQTRLTQIVDVTMDAVQKDGYKATQIKAKITEGTQAVAINAEKAKKLGLILWAPVGKGVVLLICETVPGK